jgi:hypothetical protein
VKGNWALHRQEVAFPGPESRCDLEQRTFFCGSWTCPLGNMEVFLCVLTDELLGACIPSTSIPKVGLASPTLKMSKLKPEICPKLEEWWSQDLTYWTPKSDGSFEWGEKTWGQR